MVEVIRRVLAAVLLVSLALLVVPGSRRPASAHVAMQVLHQGRPVHILVPGAPISVLSMGLGGSGGSYCLGIVSVRDHYGLPVSLGRFRPGDDGVMAIQTRVPLNLFPAEPPGPFMLYAGRCTNVAPDGNYGSLLVTIVPALG